LRARKIQLNEGLDLARYASIFEHSLAKPALDDKEHDCDDPEYRNPPFARRRYRIGRAKNERWRGHVKSRAPES
jgi:hypothetical protein